jgi:hypothetical protein
MSVDYEGIGGIGVVLTNDIIREMDINCEKFSLKDWESGGNDYLKDYLLESGLKYEMAGNCYTGDIFYVILMEAETLGDINSNAGKFCSMLGEIGIKIEAENLSVISEMCVS